MTARSILVVSNSAALTVNSTDATYSPHGTAITVSTTLDQFHYRPPIAVTAQNLATFEAVAAGGTNKTYKAFLNGSASALAVTIADGGAVGTITSNDVDTLSLAAGDRLSFVGRKIGGTSMQVGHRAVLVAPGAQSVSPLVLTAGGVALDSSTRLYAVSGSYGVVTYGVTTRMTVRSPGDWRGLYVHVTANSGSAASIIRGAVNDADAAMLVSIGAGETGYFFDNTNVVPLTDGDHIQYRKTGTTGTNYNIATIGSSIVNSTRTQQLYGYASRAWSVALMNGVAHTGLPGPDYGNSVTSVSFTAYERTVGYPARVGTLQVAAANTLDVDVTATMFVNGTATSLVVTIASGTSELVENTTDTVVVGPNDKIGFKWATVGTATTGTFSARSWSLCIDDLEGGATSSVTWTGTSTLSPVAEASNTRSFAFAGSSVANLVIVPETPEVRTLTISGTSDFSAVGDYAVSDFPIGAEIQTLTPSARIELFELDASILGGTIYRFHAGVNGLLQPVVWAGEEYSPFPVQATGFEYSGQGPLPRPKFRVANVAGVMSSLVMLYEDLAGCKVTRIRTMAKFLDEVNFPAGNPTADPEAEYPREIYYIDRKASESRDVVEFELSSSLDMAGVMFPSRQVVQNYCPWAYRGAECGYTGTDYFDTNDQVVAVLAQDVCGKRLSSCRARFGQYGELPYGGFPAAGLLRM
jgi:lambda family phage minor tail protein L